MTKILHIGWKDLKIIFRDRAALILMLVAPFALTLGMGLITGSFSSGGSGISQLSVVVVNQDGGQLGEALQNVLTSADLADLLVPTLLADPVAARQQVDADQIAAAVIVPAGFTDSIIPKDTSGVAAATVSIEVYKNPARPISSGVVESIVRGFVDRVEAGRVGGQVAIEQLLANGMIAPQEIPKLAQELGAEQADQTGTVQLIRVKRLNVLPQQTNTFNPLLLMAPGMALVFLMFTVSLGSRSILVEREEGTLARILRTPRQPLRKGGAGRL